MPCRRMAQALAKPRVACGNYRVSVNGRRPGEGRDPVLGEGKKLDSGLRRNDERPVKSKWSPKWTDQLSPMPTCFAAPLLRSIRMTSCRFVFATHSTPAASE